MLAIKLPYQLLRDRFALSTEWQSSFIQQATLFQDLVIRCVRYAFANLPADVGRVFFCKEVAYPFFRYRMLRHGYLSLPVNVNEVHKGGVRGLWMSHDIMNKPDLIIYYCHGMSAFSPEGTFRRQDVVLINL